jgi:hypothetical protein
MPFERPKYTIYTFSRDDTPSTKMVRLYEPPEERQTTEEYLTANGYDYSVVDEDTISTINSLNRDVAEIQRVYDLLDAIFPPDSYK